jgi:hypothetical protein
MIADGRGYNKFYTVLFRVRGESMQVFEQVPRYLINVSVLRNAHKTILASRGCLYEVEVPQQISVGVSDLNVSGSKRCPRCTSGNREKRGYCCTDLQAYSCSSF